MFPHGEMPIASFQAKGTTGWGRFPIFAFGVREKDLARGEPGSQEKPLSSGKDPVAEWHGMVNNMMILVRDQGIAGRRLGPPPQVGAPKRP